jgi:hypothetical protein
MEPQKFYKEIGFLIDCLRRVIGQNQRYALREDTLSEMDWNFLIPTAQRHGVLPLFSQGISRDFSQPSPAGVPSELRELFYSNVRRNLYVLSELFEWLDLLGSHGIQAIPLKGPVLSYFLHGNAALRQSIDHDILIHKRNLAKAKSLLLHEGFQPIYSLPDTLEGVFLENECEITLAHPQGKTNVELHWGFAPRYFSVDLDMEGMWKRLEAISVGGREILNLCKEDLLVMLCIHGSKHLWNRLMWICDVAKLIHSHRELDWNRVMKQVHDTGTERMLHVGLWLAKDILQAELPGEILRGITRDRQSQSLSRKVASELFSDSYAVPSVYQFHGFHLQVRERLHDRILFCLRILFLPTLKDFMSVKLPERLRFFYYWIHPLRLALRQAFQLSQKLMPSSRL